MAAFSPSMFDPIESSELPCLLEPSSTVLLISLTLDDTLAASSEVRLMSSIILCRFLATALVCAPRSPTSSFDMISALAVRSPEASCLVVSTRSSIGEVTTFLMKASPASPIARTAMKP